jgi:hypothetical protein
MIEPAVLDNVGSCALAMISMFFINSYEHQLLSKKRDCHAALAMTIQEKTVQLPSLRGALATKQSQK